MGHPEEDPQDVNGQILTETDQEEETAGFVTESAVSGDVGGWSSEITELDELISEDAYQIPHLLITP